MCIRDRLDSFDLIPKLLAVRQVLGRAVRQHHLRVNDAGLVREIVVPIEPLVVQP